MLTFSGLGFSGKHAQETASVFSGLFNGIFETHFWQNSNIREPRFSMHLEGAQKCMMILREELAAWLGLASAGVGLRGTATGDRMHLDGI